MMIKERKKAFNINLSRMGKLDAQVLAKLEGLSVSELVEMLVRKEARDRGVEHVFSAQEIKKAILSLMGIREDR